MNNRKMPIPLQMTIVSSTSVLRISFLLLFLLPFSTPVSFLIDRFDPQDERILYSGDAASVVGAVELTNKINYLARVGWATYAHPVQLWDTHSNELTDFTCRFTFFVDTKGRAQFASGLTFFLAPAGFSIPPNSAGGFFALYNTTTSDLNSNKIFHVEFDTFENPEWDPVGVGPHIGINPNSVASAVHTPWNVTFHGDDDAEVVITYTASTKNLTVSWKYLTTTNSQENSSISYQVDLKEILPQFVTVGFSAATSNLYERHVIKHWEFNSTFDGNDEPADGGDGVVRKNDLLLIILLVLIVSVSVSIFIVCVICYRKKSQRKKRRKLNEKTGDETEPLNYPLDGPISYQLIASATNNFSEERKVGDGKVYKAVVNVPVAVKRVVTQFRRGIEDKVEVISKLRDRNLVQILGWGEEKGELLVVYEFVANGALDSHLFCEKSSDLDWYKRWKIVLGVACGLVRLHEGSEMEECSVVHGGIKASNVMIDSSFEAKLGDFSFADETGGEGEAGKSEDVFNFGVLVLEILTGRKSSETDFLKWIRELSDKNSHMSAVDKKLTGFVREEAERLMLVGLSCTNPHPGQRPPAREALLFLRSNDEQKPRLASDVLESSVSVRSYASDESSELKLGAIHSGR